MVAADPARRVWGLGRSHIGSNFLLVPARPGGQLRRIRQRPRRHHRRPSLEARRRRRPAGHRLLRPVPHSFITPHDPGALMALGSRG